MMKGIMGADRQRNWSELGKEGRLLILFVSQVIGCYMAYIRKTKLNKDFHSLQSILYETVKGDKEFEVGSITTIAGKQFRIKRMKLRNNHMYTRKGRTAKAYEIKRIFGERS